MEQYDVVVEVRMTVEAESQEAANKTALEAVDGAVNTDQLLTLTLDREGILGMDLWCDGELRYVHGGM